ncbi:hypothetical protein CNR22_23945 [Sphingobacteriaceae bacterium]|nr:hypothetical protein CNR22_23945 [Sphingobacteriaceae bacterium]
MVWMQQNSDGQVVANLHPRFKIDPLQPVFMSNFDYVDRVLCGDTFFSHLDFHSPRWGDMKEDKTFSICNRSLDFSFQFIFCNHHGWIGSSDLYELLRLPTGSMSWFPEEKNSYRMTSYRHDYVCSNDSHGYDSYDDQVWQVDKDGRVESIFIYSKDSDDSVGKLLERVDLDYTSFGKIQKITYREFYGTKTACTNQWQREWYYDEQHREAMMINYSGSPRKFNSNEINSYNYLLNQAITSQSTVFKAKLDSNNIDNMVLYTYGTFGIEQVNGYYAPADYTNIRHYYTDSIFYNPEGKIVRYVGGYDMMGSSGEMLYCYDNESSRLMSVTGRSKGCIYKKVQQWFSYTDNKVSSLREKIYDLQPVYMAEKQSDPVEKLQEERLYTYRYKSAKK